MRVSHRGRGHGGAAETLSSRGRARSGRASGRAFPTEPLAAPRACLQPAFGTIRQGGK